MDIKDLRALVKLITETDIVEFELENSQDKIRIKRGVVSEVAHYAIPQQGYALPSAQINMQTVPIVTPSADEPEPVAESGHSVLSPIVGTFYRSPAPDAAPFVEVGQVVEKGAVLCIVEAMKLMNEIEAEARCKIIKICKSNAQPVEYGDALFVVEPL